MQWIRNIFLTTLLLSATFALAEETPKSININTASVEQLSKLKGIGATKAKAIVAYREQKGLFTSVDELVLVKGIGENTIKKNRALLITSAE